MLHPRTATDGQPSAAGLSILRDLALPVSPEDHVTRYQKWPIFQFGTWSHPSWLERFLSGGGRSGRPRAAGILCDQDPGGVDRHQECFSRPGCPETVGSEIEGQGPSPPTAVGNAII